MMAALAFSSSTIVLYRTDCQAISLGIGKYGCGDTNKSCDGDGRPELS